MEIIDIIDNVDTTAPVEIAVLPEKKARALEMLLLDIPVKTVAESIGYDVSTVYKWIKRDIEFKKHLDRKEEIILNELYDVALYRLEEMLLSDNLYSQQYAISQIVKIKCKNEININVTEKPKSVAELIAQTKKY
ncbi:helix-turn-helix domain-containing protein [Clostridioides difficile]|uniref:helix-turn-helix domain-containing protein n=1 Tax=Clostridioides difficile TaxID=1496 RepID=UPI001C142F80|nr:helix-turn-helix domain-containing protein [Clostridioides difficile]HBF6291368.1 helix-turn-helix domain-containing protein [Clostridioides difficile]HBG4071402.1 helix-turn-helix domain-containing protein [Clostridioides difficile]HBY2690096.1 helix-turn-helix domain-containing protein [Clostridioides difficile]HDO9121448.1 helix-turn-helix domain-containing protein [Clostridioides difficile]